jgi:hypothetical protein
MPRNSQVSADPEPQRRHRRPSRRPQRAVTAAVTG